MMAAMITKPQHPDAPPLELVNLSKTYGTLKAVDDVSFTVQQGEIFGLLGPNGAGKTTTISMVTTLTRPTKGEIRVFGKRLTEEPQACKQLFGAVPQEMVTHGFFNVMEVLIFHSGYYGLRNNDAWLRYILSRLKLWEHRDKPVRALSGGMKKRLLIAKALVHRPPLVLLDEPTAGVDIELRDTLWQFITELNEQGTSVLLTTHYLQEAEELCHRVAIIDHGQIKQLGATRELVEELTQQTTRVTLKEPSGALTSPYLMSSDGREVLFQAPANISLANLLESANIDPRDIRDVHTLPGNLEDAVRQVINIPGRSASP